MKQRIKQQWRKWNLSRKKPVLCKLVRQRFQRLALALKRCEQREEEREFRKMIRKRRSKKSDLPPYLTENSWEHELNYKLWITKSARFAAARRCEEMDTYGQWAMTILSAYLIIVGLIPYIPHPAFKGLSPELLGFGTTSLSIILLGCSLLISSRQYPLQAKAYHECALKIGILYDRLRQAKEIEDGKLKREEIVSITREYEILLPGFPNHHPIDHDMFQTQKPAYFKLGWRQIYWRKFRYYFRTRAFLDAMILAGLLSVGAMAWMVGKDGISQKNKQSSPISDSAIK